MPRSLAYPAPPVALDSPAADWRAGLLAGLAAGVVLSIVHVVVTTLLLGEGPWSAPKMAVSLLAGRDVIRPGFEAGPVLGGMAVHLALSAAFGLLFASVTSVVPIPLAPLGAAYGFVAYVTALVLVPGLFPGWAGHMAPAGPFPHVIAALEHVAFGSVLGAVYGRWRSSAPAE